MVAGVLGVGQLRTSRLRDCQAVSNVGHSPRSGGGWRASSPRNVVVTPVPGMTQGGRSGGKRLLPGER